MSLSEAEIKPNKEENNNLNNSRTCNHPRKKMSTAQNLLFRLSIVLTMAAAVVTILYLTPMPDQNFKSCDRPCHQLDWPMICRVKLNIEMYQTDNHICQGCTQNSSQSSHCKDIFCTMTDNDPKGILTANRQLPGPAIQVCQNDILIVDVINKIPGHSISIHWRGQPNDEAPFMDGVPMITQCPIPSFTTFQYKFRASYAGTHFYHAFADTDRTRGLFGALVVRKADKIEPHRKLYDVDDKRHVVLISEWSGDFASELSIKNDAPKTLLINGRAPSEKGSNLAVYQVKSGKRYRFRAAYTAGSLGCPVTLSIDNHFIKVIELDGDPITPYEVSNIELSKGERVDFILKASQEKGAFYLNVKSNCHDTSLSGLAVVNYEEAQLAEKENKRKGDAKKSVEDSIFARNFNTSFCGKKLGKVCLDDVKPLKKLDDKLRDPVAKKKVFLELDFRYQEKDTIQGGYTDLQSKIYRINNLTFSFPPSPLLTQYSDVSKDFICNQYVLPPKCKNKKICECLHIEYVPLGDMVELIFIEQGGETEHVFHLHGHHFHVVGYRQFDRPMSRQEIEELDLSFELVKRNLQNPPKKDTIRVPRYAVVVVRFLADHAGMWMLRDEKSNGWTKGSDMVFQVGDNGDSVSTPSNFPTCGNYIGPDFFLL